MPEIKPHEYSVLNEIAQNPMVTQANLSDRLGIAVGSVNWYIKRLIARGWVKVSHLDRTRLKYDLTTAGMKIFTRRAVLYARDSLKIYGDFRNKARIMVTELKRRGIKHVYLDANDEMMDIFRLTCIEEGILLLDSPAEVIVINNGLDYSMKVQTDKQNVKK